MRRCRTVIRAPFASGIEHLSHKRPRPERRGRSRAYVFSGRIDFGEPRPEEDLSAMLALPGVAFDAVRWVKAKSDKRGYVEVCGNRHCAAPPGTAASSCAACGPEASRYSTGTLGR